MRRLLILVCISALAASCSTIKKASAPSEQQVRTPASSKSKSDPVFIENISFKPGSEKKQADNINIDKGPAKESHIKGSNTTYTPAAIEVLPTLRFKYAILLDAPVEELSDDRLISFMHDWYGTRYRLGGADKSGIDCSAFVQTFFIALYGVEVARTCREQYLDSRRITKKLLQEGDLVFFKTRGKSISHVGVYLRNNKFIHASTSSGVMISDLGDEYFAKRYAGAGRVKE
ncbi:MAG: NlpC/P60 family protein [Chitinophagaceae bacterium]